MAGLVPFIHVLLRRPIDKAWMPGTRPGMTNEKSAREERYDPFDIVVVPFPYADRLAEKRRPALVISNRKLAVHASSGWR